MLTASVDGVKGDKWFDLMDKRPNAFFAREGLFAMSAAKEEEEDRMRRSLFGPLKPT
jgi:hypothetical protein